MVNSPLKGKNTFIFWSEIWQTIQRNHFIYYPIFWLHTRIERHIQKEPPTLMLFMGETKRVILQGAAVTGGNPWTLQQDERQSHNVKKGWLYEWPQSLLKLQWSVCTNMLCLNKQKNCSHQLWIKLADLLDRHERCTS